MNDISVYDYSTPVHRVLLEPNLLLGIGIMPAMLILVLTIVLMNVVSIWCVTIGVILYVAAKMVCKKDHFLLLFHQNMCAKEAGMYFSRR